MGHQNSGSSLDVRSLAREGGTVQGAAPLAQFLRLKEDLAEVPADATVAWDAHGQWRIALGGEGQTWLHLQVRATVPLVCQRCMEVVHVPMAIDRSFRFAPDEAQAAALDEDSEEDVLALGSDLDLLQLVEDELLLSLPLVPRHEVCPTAPRLQVQDPGFVDEAEAPKVNPFAVLKDLR